MNTSTNLITKKDELKYPELYAIRIPKGYKEKIEFLNKYVKVPCHLRSVIEREIDRLISEIKKPNSSQVHEV